MSTLAISRAVERLLAEIACANDTAHAVELAGKAIKSAASLEPPASDRLIERVLDALAERLVRDEGE